MSGLEARCHDVVASKAGCRSQQAVKTMLEVLSLEVLGEVEAVKEGRA